MTFDRRRSFGGDIIYYFLADSSAQLYQSYIIFVNKRLTDHNPDITHIKMHIQKQQ